MIRTFILTSALSLPAAGMAADQPAQSILFQGKGKGETTDPIGSTHTPMKSIQQGGDPCAQLAKKIDQLKGKPQQRYAARQRFELECRSTDHEPTS
jgi:hypothetical protein